MMSRNEDRELQIRLAELQADVEINLTACFGFLATFAALILFLEEEYFSPSLDDAQKILFLILILAVGIALAFIERFFIRRAMNARKEMAELRKKYVW